MTIPHPDATVFHGLPELKSLLSTHDSASLEPIDGVWLLFRGSGDARQVLAIADPGYNAELNARVVDRAGCLQDTAAYPPPHEFTQRTSLFFAPSCGHEACASFARCAGCYIRFGGGCARKPPALRKSSLGGFPFWRKSASVSASASANASGASSPAQSPVKSP